MENFHEAKQLASFESKKESSADTFQEAGAQASSGIGWQNSFRNFAAFFKYRCACQNPYQAQGTHIPCASVKTAAFFLSMLQSNDK